MFFWTLEIIVEPMVYAGVFYFLYVFINGKDLGLKIKLLIIVLLLPTLLLASSKFGLLGYNLTSCDRDAVEGPLAHYGYFIEIVLILLSLGLAVKSFIKTKISSERNKIVLVTAGSLGFLLAFSFGNVVGSLFSDSNILGDYSWSIGQYGIFGVPIFVAFLAYLIVKYHSFNIKTFGAQVLVAALLILIGSELFFVTNTMNQVLVMITLILTSIGGFLLVKSVAGEIKAKEDLQIANAGQENLIHIMNHQIKGYLAKARNIFAELLSEPDYCAAEEAKPMISEGLRSLTEGVDFVQQVLQGSSAQSGKLVYTTKPMNFRSVAYVATEEQGDNAKAKGLVISFKSDAEEYKVNGDDVQLREAVKNLINNSINYTEKGSIEVGMNKKGNKVLLSVKDTGIGINKEDMGRLFQTGGRGKDSLKYNVNSTGYGLAFVRGVVEAHQGRVWAESAGQGLGSAFYLELPLS